jgi:thiamine pyrophosphokinase
LLFQPTILHREDGFTLTVLVRAERRTREVEARAGVIPGMQRIIIFANGDLPDIEKARALLRADDFIICADGGTRHALALGIMPNLVIGDMDSIQTDQWQELEKVGVSVELFPRDKNETDLELALDRAVEFEPQQIVIIAAFGGRLDQTIGNIALLTDIRLSAFDVRLADGEEEMFICRDQIRVYGRSGDIVSLIPWGNPVRGIQTQGLKWALRSETLYPEKTRGISNELLSETADIKIASGTLLVLHTRKS